MTMIVQYLTKKALKEAADTFPEAIRVQDPALLDSWLTYGKEYFSLREMKIGDVITVTNHPKRSWFATILRKNQTTWSIG